MGHQKRIEFGAPNERVAVKANDLVRARHSFSTIEQRIFVAMVAQLDRDSEKFSIQEVPIKDICSNTNESDLYRRIDEITDRLLERVVEIRAEDESGNEEGFVKYNVFSRCQYEKGSGIIQARFTEEMRPFLLQLKERYTLYLITVFFNLESKYTTQLYELLKMRQGLHGFQMSVEEFRRTLALENKYERFSSMKRRVIEQARTELKEKGDIYFTYNVIRNGNVPVEIEFFIHDNEPVIEELKRGNSQLKREDVSVGREKQSRKSGEGPNLDPKGMFKSDLNQEQVESIDSSHIDRLYEEARSRALTENYDTNSEVVLQQKTYTNMKKIWEDRQVASDSS